jgi:hypothetical protein
MDELRRVLVHRVPVGGVRGQLQIRRIQQLRALMARCRLLRGPTGGGRGMLRAIDTGTTTDADDWTSRIAYFSVIFAAGLMTPGRGPE